MARPNERMIISAHQYAQIQEHAKRALESADAIGVFPTPVAQIMAAEKITVDDKADLDEGYLAKLRKGAGNALKRAWQKVVGVFDTKGRVALIDKTIAAVKQTFIKLHELAHGFLPWQRDMYGVIEECNSTLDPDIADLFDREANLFAAEVLFQLESFTEEANCFDFGIKVPLKLARKYGASAYASIRRYVEKNPKACTVLVYEPPVPQDIDGFLCKFLRVSASDSFRTIFGDIEWPEVISPDDWIGAAVPVGKKRMTGRRRVQLTDRNGTTRTCIAEGFTQGYQVFILIQAVETLNVSIFLPS